MSQNPTLRIELSSHTDSRGKDSYNLRLSQQRAEAAVNYLVNKGIEPSRMVAKGYGEARLLNHCGNGVQCSEDEHQANRRTEIKVLKY
jgi:outer membrane protein OmpA-like peptidoglycan-associated protein